MTSTTRALVVDDELVVAELIALHVEGIGHAARMFTDPLEALSEFRRDPEAFDVLVTDYLMPGLSGLDLAEEIWKIRPTMPVVFASGQGHDLAFKVLGRPAQTTVLHKPFRRPDMAEALRKVLAS